MHPSAHGAIPSNSSSQSVPTTEGLLGRWAVPNRPATPFKSSRARPWLVISVATLVAILGLIAALLYGEPTYVAEATVRVSLNSAAPLDPNEARMDAINYRDFIQQQVYEIGKYSNVLASLDRLGSQRSLVQGVGETDRFAAEKLMSLLKVTALTDSYFISVSLEGDHPEGLADIVNAVVNTYLEREAAQEQTGTAQSVQLLTDREGQLKQAMTTDRETLDQIMSALGITTIDSKAANPYEKLLTDENVALARAHRAVLLAQAKVNALKSHQQELEDLGVSAKAQEMLTNNPETTPAKSQLMEQREAAFLELSGLGPNHPARPALEQKIAGINEELKKLDAAALERIRASLRTSEGAKSDATVAEAEANLEQAQRSERELQKDLDAQRGGAGSFSAKYSQGAELQQKLEQERKDLQDVEDRISVLRIEHRAPVYVSLDAPAMMPDLPQKARRRKIFALFLLLALGLGVGVPTAIDLIDPRIKTSAELAGVLGFPPLGAAQMQRGHLAHETLRRIALGILQERRASGVRTFVLTPVREVAGTTTLALRLAAELSEFGARTLAIEANPLAPDARYVDTRPEKSPLHRTPKISSARATTGLARQVAPAALMEARTQAAVRGTESLPERFSIAQRADGVGLVLASARDIVALALEKYDIVLLDAPPLLESADPLLLMQMPAGVILVVRAERDQIAEVRAAAHELERLAPPVVGAVLNVGLSNGHRGGALATEPLTRPHPAGTGSLVPKPGFTA